jgi:hypothetical protein
MGLADLHIHTRYSFDGTASVPSALGQAASQPGLDVGPLRLAASWMGRRLLRGLGWGDSSAGS